MTENLPEYNPGELWWRLIFSPGVAGEFGLKNKMPNKIKLETQDQSVHQSTQEQLLSDNYQHSLPFDWTSYELHMYLRVCVSAVRRDMFYMAAEVHKMQSLIKTTSSDQIQCWWRGDDGASLHYIFRNLNCILF